MSSDKFCQNLKFILYRTLENAPDSDDSAGSVNVNSKLRKLGHEKTRNRIRKSVMQQVQDVLASGRISIMKTKTQAFQY